MTIHDILKENGWKDIDKGFSANLQLKFYIKNHEMIAVSKIPYIYIC